MGSSWLLGAVLAPVQGRKGRIFLVWVCAALASTVVLTGCGGSGGGPAAESITSSQGQSEESSGVISSETLKALGAISVAQAEQESGVTVDQIRSYVSDPSNTPYLEYLRNEATMTDSQRPSANTEDPYAIEAKAALDDTNLKLLESLLQEKGITPERLLELYNWYQTNMEQIKAYLSQPDLLESERDMLYYAQIAQVGLASISEKVVSGKIKLQNQYDAKEDPRVEKLYVEYYGSEERVIQRFGSSPIGKTFIPTIENGNLDTNINYDVSEYNIPFGELMSYETWGPYEADASSGANVNTERERINSSEAVLVFLRRIPAQ